MVERLEARLARVPRGSLSGNDADQWIRTNEQDGGSGGSVAQHSIENSGFGDPFSGADLCLMGRDEREPGRGHRHFLLLLSHGDHRRDEGSCRKALEGGYKV